MKNRIDLDNKLRELLGTDQVYFQPPATLRVRYPAIIYSFDNNQEVFADDSKYLKHKRYSITLIDKDPESPIADNLDLLPFCKLSNVFVTDNLYHWVYRIHI